MNFNYMKTKIPSPWISCKKRIRRVVVATIDMQSMTLWFDEESSTNKIEEMEKFPYTAQSTDQITFK